MVRLDSVLNSWKTVRADAAQAVEDLPPNELDFKPLADVMSFREVATHILQAGYGLTGLLLDGVENMAVPEFRQMIGKHVAELPATKDSASLATELRTSLDKRAGELSAKPAEFWSQEIVRFDGQKSTRLEMLQMIKEHELTHRAQLFLFLRMKNIVPPTTRRRQAAQAKA